MQKPRIKILFFDGKPQYICDIANKAYGNNIWNIDGLFKVLKIMWLCEKDENGKYINQQ